MRKKKWWIFLVAPPALVLLVWICGEVVMHLWNWLLPMLFGWHQITFWQGLGLLVLCRILFGSWTGHGSDRSRRWRRMPENWERMTPEEREKFRQGMRARCGGFAAPTGETREPA
jgi:hypothetical protein